MPDTAPAQVSRCTAATVPMPRVRSVLTVQQQKSSRGVKVWRCGVEDCEYFAGDADAKEMDNHLGSEHDTECIASDVLWLDKHGHDFVPKHCPCVCSRQVVMDNGSGSEETKWVRVCNVVSNLLQDLASLLSNAFDS